MNAKEPVTVEVWIATVDAGRFEFMECGTSEDHARQLVKEMWDKHCERRPWATITWEDLLHELCVYRAQPGMRWKDREEVSGG